MNMTRETGLIMVLLALTASALQAQASLTIFPVTDYDATGTWQWKPDVTSEFEERINNLLAWRHNDDNDRYPTFFESHWPDFFWDSGIVPTIGNGRRYKAQCSLHCG